MPRPKTIFMLYLSMLLTTCALPFTRWGLKPLPYLLILPLFFFALRALDARLAKATGDALLVIEPRAVGTQSRLLGLDIIKCVAVVFVPVIHFFGNTGYYSTSMNTPLMMAATLIRWVSIVAVPLFLMITGYLKINAGFTRKHFRAVIPIFLCHLFISTIRIFVDYAANDVSITPVYVADKLLYFDYGWYVKLYIGMLLLMPFFNLCYRQLASLREKLYLLLVLMLLVSIGPLCFYVVPVSWLILYVFLFYFLGAFFREYRVCIPRSYLIGALLLTAIVTAAASFRNAAGGIFNWSYLGYVENSGYSSLPVVIMASLIFLIFQDADVRLPALRRLCQSVSTLSLEMYLFSQIFDTQLYRYFQARGADFYSFLHQSFWLMPLIILLSYLASLGKQLIFRSAAKLFKH